MDKERAIDLIQKLLRKTEANGATPAEAASAIATAQRLMAQHKVEMSEVEVEGESENGVIEEGIDVGTKSVSTIQTLFAKCLAEHFACRVILRWNSKKGAYRLVFIGESVNCKAFKEVYMFAYNAFKFNWECYHKTLHLTSVEKSAARGTYLKGFIAGLTNELIKSENENALVIVESPKVQEYMSGLNLKRSNSHLSMRASNSMRDFAKGYADGSYSQSNKNSLQ